MIFCRGNLRKSAILVILIAGIMTSIFIQEFIFSDYIKKIDKFILKSPDNVAKFRFFIPLILWFVFSGYFVTILLLLFNNTNIFIINSLIFPIFQVMYFFNLYNDNAEVARLEFIGSMPLILSAVLIFLLKYFARLFPIKS
ncbi:hypothetical protein NSE01_06470 [Novosphingobium sediminis]|uniref:Uncharacterized protein n=1 Tax=Novosphingobium sediminis TaxID=707214 RepID=A0A512AGI0_9SPHN|nr:hypothetical protein NSE01_06470 [Novosphingobium sediminis]